MPTHQMWSCHVTQVANFEKFYFVLILHLILGEVTKFLLEKLSTSEVISQKSHGGGNTPVPFRVKPDFYSPISLVANEIFTYEKC